MCLTNKLSASKQMFCNKMASLKCKVYIKVPLCVKVPVHMPMVVHFRALNLMLARFIRMDLKGHGIHWNGQQWGRISPNQFIQIYEHVLVPFIHVIARWTSQMIMPQMVMPQMIMPQLWLIWTSKYVSNQISRFPSKEITLDIQRVFSAGMFDEITIITFDRGMMAFRITQVSYISFLISVINPLLEQLLKTEVASALLIYNDLRPEAYQYQLPEE